MKLRQRFVCCICFLAAHNLPQKKAQACIVLLIMNLHNEQYNTKMTAEKVV